MIETYKDSKLIVSQRLVECFVAWWLWKFKKVAIMQINLWEEVELDSVTVELGAHQKVVMGTISKVRPGLYNSLLQPEWYNGKYWTFCWKLNIFVMGLLEWTPAFLSLYLRWTVVLLLHALYIETQWTSFTSNLETLLKCSLVDKTAPISQNTPKVNENSMVDSKLSSFYHIKPANKVWKSDWLVDPFRKLTETTISTKFEKKSTNVTK